MINPLTNFLSNVSLTIISSLLFLTSVNVASDCIVGFSGIFGLYVLLLDISSTAADPSGDRCAVVCTVVFALLLLLLFALVTGSVVICPSPVLVPLVVLPFGPPLLLFPPLLPSVDAPVLFPEVNEVVCPSFPEVFGITLVFPPTPVPGCTLLVEPLLGSLFVLFGGVLNFVISIFSIYTLLQAMAFTE